MTICSGVVVARCDYLKIRAAALAVLFAAFLAPGIPEARAVEWSHPSLEAEALYSEAVLAYNAKQSTEALKSLDELLKSTPDHIQALELKALTLKTMGQPRKSFEVYRKLLLLTPEKDRGPYHFELGMILNQEKRPELAKVQFEAAVRHDFNTVTSQLFLGLIAFNSADYNTAEARFNEVRAAGNTEFRVVAHYYLGLSQLKGGMGAIGTQELIAARDLASEIPDNKMAADIRTGAEKILAPFGESNWFGNLSVLTQYDSNISNIPTSVATSTQVSNKSTIKSSLLGGFGRMSSPLSDFQWVGSYRISYNKNFNADTRGYEFFGNTPSLYINYKPLARTTAGLKLEGGFNFQNQLQDSSVTTGPYVFRTYNMTGEIGPYIKHQIDRRLAIQADVAVKPSKYYSDSTLGGNSYASRIAIRKDGQSRFWNPSATLSAELSRVTSNEYKYNAYGLGVADSVRFSATTNVNLSVDYLMTKYFASSTGRSDKNLGIQLSVVRTLTPKWAILANFNMNKNTSTDADTYTYDRITSGLGLSWTL